MKDEEYMLRAIGLAEKGRGFTNPNPCVGAVIVKDGRIIGEGYHERCGELHAERNAIKHLTESAEDATMYVTLEPCCHYGKTPPCTEAIIENKITKVVIGSRDPNPLVAGKGAAILREAGIEVVEDFMREECDKLNDVFFHFITTGMPYTVLKYAMTADGKTATKTGASKWITGEVARNKVQYLRHNYAAIAAGIGTVLADDPLLNVRVKGLTSPVRVICDSKLRIPLDCQICKTAGNYRTIVACNYNRLYDNPNRKIHNKIKALEDMGVEVVSFPGQDGRVDLYGLMKYLGEHKIDSVLVEGGGMLNEGILKAGLANEVNVFIAPKIFGGSGSISPVEGLGVDVPSDAYMLKLHHMEMVGDDLLLNYKVVNKELMIHTAQFIL
ncbi:MAG: Riboflavin biosynthesis protein RibD [Lachnoclostridium sp.]